MSPGQNRESEAKILDRQPALANAPRHLGAIRRASPAIRMAACRNNLISQTVPTASRRVGLGDCRAGIRPSSIWAGRQKGDGGKTMTELRYLAPATLDEAI